jgi:hypothetical protein
MSMRDLNSLGVKAVTTMGRALGIGCYFVGTVVRSRQLRALGLPSLAERNFRRKNYDAACLRAMELLELVESDPNDWNYGNAVHKAHLMLGRVAVVRGDLTRAEAELLAAARVPGSPQLASFGPNMQLALELLQAGRKECVLEYFALCEKFLELGKRQLHAWSDDIKSGRQPAVGGNLIY